MPPGLWVGPPVRGRRPGRLPRSYRFAEEPDRGPAVRGRDAGCPAPPQRSVHALLTHTALIGIFWRKTGPAGGMYDSWFGQVLVKYPKFAEPFRNRIRENAKKMAAEAGIEMEFIRRRNFRMEDRVKEILAKRGEHTGLVCIFSAMEPCPTYKPWHNKQTGKTFPIQDEGKCLHYYFYFVDEDLGLCHVHVPTWLPCRLQICFNGHNWLAGQLSKRASIIEWLTMRSATLRTGNGRSASPTDGKQNESTRGSTSSRGAAARSIGTSPRIPLERGPVRIRHRHRLPQAGGSAGDL